MASAGIEKMNALRQGGFSDQEVEQWRTQTTQDLYGAGFSQREIGEYFGQPPEPDMTALSKFFEANLSKLRGAAAANAPGGDSVSGSTESLPGELPQTPAPPAAAAATATPGPESPGAPAPAANGSKGDQGAMPPAREAKSFLDVLEAGWDMSVTGLMLHPPEVMLPEHAPMFYRIAANVGTLAGDIPAMIAGGYAGGMAGGAAGAAAGTALLPGPGTAIGAAAGTTIGSGAGAFALPAALREILIQHYKKGDIKDFRDFWERGSAVFLEATKAGLIGGATAGVGGLTGKALEGVAQPLVRTAAQTAAEVATMTTVGSALEGQVPTPENFAEAAIFVGGLHAVVSGADFIKPLPRAVTAKITEKMQDIYAKTGLRPEQVAQHAAEDSSFREQLLSDSPEIPQAYKELIDPKAAPPTELKELKPVGKIAEPATVLNPDTKTGLKVEPLPEQPQAAGGGGKEPPSRPPAQQAVLDRISQEKPQRERPTFDQFYFQVVDDLHPIKQARNFLAGEKVVEVKDDPYALARLQRGSYGMADQMIEHGTFDFNTRATNGRGLKEILDPVKDDLDSFRAYAVAARVTELAKRGIDTGVDLDAAKATYRAGKEKFDGVFKEFVQFQNNTLAYMRDSGLISPDSYKAMVEANQNYVPFFRLMDEGRQAKVDSQGLRVKNPIKRIQGSERKIIDPIESAIKNTYTYVTLAERNNVLAKLADLAEANPDFASYTDAKGNPLMEKSKLPMRPIEVKSEEMDRFLEEHGLDPQDEAMTIFRPGSVQLAPNEVQIYRDGKREIWKVAPELAESVKALDRESTGLLLKMLSKPASLLRAGSVLAPDFITRNLARDQLMAFVNSNHNYIPVVDALRGLGSLWKKDEVYQAWLKNGGANAAMVAIDRDYISQKVFKLNEETGFMDTARNVVKSPIEMLRVTSELIENATRLGEFKKAYRAGVDPRQAALESREVTLDFARKGANGSVRAMNMITAFWNAQIQGVDRMVREFKDNPNRAMAKTVAAITIPSVLLYMANKDDPRWKDIPRWQKDLFWIVMTKDNVYRIPKPHEPGLMFGSVVERTLEAFEKDNPKAFKDFGDSVLQAFEPGYVPTFASPVIEQFANKSTFTGSPIIPYELEGVLPEYQYTERTTETAKTLGRLLANTLPDGRTSQASSPMLIENYVRAWSGNMGMYALQIGEKALKAAGVAEGIPNEPTKQLAELPVIKAFMIRYPSANTQTIVDFQERYKENKQVVDTIRHLARTGDFNDMQAEITLQANQDKLVTLDNMSRSLGNMHKMIRLIYKNPDLTPDQKREDIDRLYSAMNATAGAGNQLFDELEKQLQVKK